MSNTPLTIHCPHPVRTWLPTLNIASTNEATSAEPDLRTTFEAPRNGWPEQVAPPARILSEFKNLAEAALYIIQDPEQWSRLHPEALPVTAKLYEQFHDLQSKGELADIKLFKKPFPMEQDISEMLTMIADMDPVTLEYLTTPMPLIDGCNIDDYLQCHDDSHESDSMLVVVEEGRAIQDCGQRGAVMDTTINGQSSRQNEERRGRRDPIANLGGEAPANQLVHQWQPDDCSWSLWGSSMIMS